MNIQHHPTLNVEEVEKHYSEKEGVPIQYVCTSATNQFADFAVDIFYRATPHPEFGNHYFGLFYRHNYTDEQATVRICNADSIEDLVFNTVEINGKYHYSQHRHDMNTVGDTSIDGGRAYFRLLGSANVPTKQFKVKNGVFKEI